VTTTIGTQTDGRPAWLADGPAADYQAMLDDGCPPGDITCAGRTHEQQMALFVARYRRQDTGTGRFGDARWWNGRRYVRVSAAGSVAPPGSSTSRHETGNALDLAGAALSWVRDNADLVAARYGWVTDTVPGELWHIAHPSDAPLTHRTAAAAVIASTTSTPAPDPWETDVNLHDLVSDCYLTIIGRPGTAPEIASWVVCAVDNSWTPAQVVRAFRDQKAAGAK
jgi:hypothetical protein